MKQTFRSTRAALLLILASLVMTIAGCGSSRDNFVFTNTNNTNNTNNTAVGNTLTVNLDTSAALNGRIVDDAASFDVELYDSNLVLVDQQSVARGQNVVFTDLPDGAYTVRAIGLDANSNPVGYFDLQATLSGNQNTSVTIEALIYGPVPAIGSTTNPFLTYSEIPDSVTVNAPFTIQVTAFNADGSVNTTQSGTAGLAVSGGTFVTAPGAVSFSNGRATFSGLRVQPGAAGAITLSATAGTLSATSPALPVQDASAFNFVVVGDYDADAVYLYDITNLAAGANNIAPSVTLTGAMVADNIDVESADNGQALWFTNSEREILYFDNYRAGGEQSPAFALLCDADTTAHTESISYDEERDILFANVYNNGGTLNVVSIFDDTATLGDDDLPTRQLTNFPGFVYCLENHGPSDRLFVFAANGSENELHVFDNASTINGDIAGISHTVLTLNNGADPFGPDYDAATDRLWFGEYIDTTDGVSFIDNVSSANGSVDVNLLFDSNVTGPYIWDTRYDRFNDRLYLSAYDEGAIWVYENASQISGSMVDRIPDSIISGANTLLQGPVGIDLVR